MKNDASIIDDDDDDTIYKLWKQILRNQIA